MKTEKIKKVGGSVLFTVVAVMTLLVVFMAGTMILVSSANHRSHINYSTAQTTVTSRTVAESTLKALTLSPKNEAYEDYFFSVNESNPRIEIPVSLAASDANAALGTLGDIDNVVVTYEGKMNFYSNGSTDGLLEGESAEKGWKERDVIKVTSSVNLGRSKSSTSIYLVVDPPNGDPGGGGGGAGFVTTGGADFDCQTGLYGGAYINLPELSATDDDDYTNPSTYRSTYTMTLVNSGSVAEANAVFNGNLALGNSNGFIFPTKGKGVTIWGDMLFNSNDHFRAFVNTDNINGTLDFNEIPYIYVDGKLTSSTNNAKPQIELTDAAGNAISNVPLNLFCGSVDIQNANAFTIKSDIYCMDAGETSVFESTEGTKLQEWSASVINKTMSNDAQTYFAGNLFSKGNVKIKGGNGGMTVDGDVRIAGDLDLSELTNGKKLEVGGDLVVGGSLIGVTKDKISVAGNIYTSGTIEGLTKSMKEGVTVEYEVDTENYVEVKNYGPLDWITVNFLDESTYPAGFSIEPQVANPATDAGNWVVKNPAGETTYIYFAPGQAWSQDFFYVAPDFETNNVKDGKFDASAGYYVEVEKDGVTWVKDSPKTEKAWYYSVTDTSDEPAHVSAEEACIPHYYVGGVEISEAEAFGGDVKDLSTYKYSNIYPAYAEKSVILGITGVGDTPKDETKVVMTMKEVLENVVNPYDSKGYPSKFKEQMTTEGSLKEYGNIRDFYADEVTGYDSRQLCKTDLNNLNTYDIAKVEYVTGPSGINSSSQKGDLDALAPNAYVINRSCVLKDFSVSDNDLGNNMPKNIVINPADGDMIIVIDGTFSLPSGWNIIVDDVTSKNNVYFYLKEGAKLNFGGGLLTTVRYSGLVKSGVPFQVMTDKTLVKKGADGKADPPTLKDLGFNTPNVFVYGDVNSELYFSNYRYIAANIVSPDITLTAAATSGDVNNEIYYNGTKVSVVDPAAKEYIFGCCNSKNTSFPNVVKVLFTPDTSDEDDVYEPEDRSHWLKVLYYDEY